MAYACSCDSVNSFSDFIEGFEDVAEIGLPALGGLSGLQTGYEQGGFLEGLNQGLAGAIKGYTALNTKPSNSVPLNTAWNPIYGASQGVSTYDPFASPQYASTSQYTYYPNTGYGAEQDALQQAIRMEAIRASQQPLTGEKILGLPKTTFLLIAGGIGIVALVLLIKK